MTELVGQRATVVLDRFCCSSVCAAKKCGRLQRWPTAAAAARCANPTVSCSAAPAAAASPAARQRRCQSHAGSAVRSGALLRPAIRPVLHKPAQRCSMPVGLSSPAAAARLLQPAPQLPRQAVCQPQCGTPQLPARCCCWVPANPQLPGLQTAEHVLMGAQLLFSSSGVPGQLEVQPAARSRQPADQLLLPAAAAAAVAAAAPSSPAAAVAAAGWLPAATAGPQAWPYGLQGVQASNPPGQLCMSTEQRA